METKEADTQFEAYLDMARWRVRVSSSMGTIAVTDTVPDGIAVLSCPVGIATVNFPMRKPVSIFGGISLPPAQNELSHGFDLPRYR